MNDKLDLSTRNIRIFQFIEKVYFSRLIGTITKDKSIKILNRLSLQESIQEVHWLIDSQMEILIEDKSYTTKDSKYGIGKNNRGSVLWETTSKEIRIILINLQLIRIL